MIFNANDCASRSVIVCSIQKSSCCHRFIIRTGSIFSGDCRLAFRNGGVRDLTLDQTRPACREKRHGAARPSVVIIGEEADARHYAATVRAMMITS